MKLKNKAISAVTAGALCMAMLGACAPSGENGGEKIPLPAGVPEDIIQETAGITKETALLRVDGKDVLAQDVLYQVSSTADQLMQYGMMDWSMDMGGMTMGEYVLDSAVETAVLYRVLENKADELGVGWSEENQAEYDEQLEQMKLSIASQNGIETTTPEGEDATPTLAPEALAQANQEYVRLLSYMGLDETGFQSINRAYFLYQNVKEKQFGAEGIEPPTAEGLAEAGVLRAKHILVTPVPSEDGSDDGVAAAQALAEDLYSQITTAEDAMATFEQLRAEYSEDKSPYTGEVNDGEEGYTFGPGEMVPEFEQGTAALEVGQVGQPVQTDYGFHIILRLDAGNEAGWEKYADIKMDAMLDELTEAATIERTEAMEQLDLQAFYEKLTQLRNTMAEAAVAETAPPQETGDAAETPAPTETPAG